MGLPESELQRTIHYYPREECKSKYQIFLFQSQMLEVILNSPPAQTAPRLNCLNRVRGSGGGGGGGGGVCCNGIS